MMSHQFPPSSPIAVEYNKSIQLKKDAAPPRQLKFNNINNYPSPLPSSSAGNLPSSPVKYSQATTTSSSPVKDIDSSFILEDSNVYTGGKITIPLELNPNQSGVYNIGRQSTGCDVILPSFKLISRKHAILSYNQTKNQLKLTCLGLNGLIVALPRVMSCPMVYNQSANTFEFSSNQSLKIVDSNQQLTKEKGLTSFILNKDQTVILPFMNGTIIDFRNVELSLTMKQLSFNDHLIHNHSKPLQRTNSNTFQSSPDNEPSHKKVKHFKISQIKKPKRSTQEIIDSLISRNVDCSNLKHVLANYLAFANVQQTPLSLLMDANSKIRALTREEVRAILTDTPCIGVIYRQGKDAAGKPLEEEYYYDLENDPNQERKFTVQSIKGGRTGLRSCRRTHKQYFWKRPANRK